MMLAYQILVVFVLGAVVGSFLNVAISRLPLEKSLLWPGSRCGHCLQPVRWYDNLPLLSYLRLGGRCRSCGSAFGMRYFLVEFTTGAVFVGLFWLEMVENIHGWPVHGRDWMLARNIYPRDWWIGYLFHCVLFSFLLAAAACDLDSREIPLSLTLTGTMIGLAGAVLLPWPWPWDGGEGLPSVFPGMPDRAAWMRPGSIRSGVYCWPVWGPLPGWLEPGDWRLGLATGAAGALMGTFLLRAIASIFSTALGREALGLGDADLMMMAGAFLGWQMVVVAFFLSVIPGLLLGILQMVIHRDSSLPFGPPLVLGTMLTLLGWRWLGPYVQPLFFWGGLLLGVLAAGAILLFLMGGLLGLLRPPAAEDPAEPS